MAAQDSHWARWHDAYEDPSSSLSHRLTVVRQRLSDALDAAPTGPLRLLSMCAGQGRDVIPTLAEHPRGPEVRALLVEADRSLVEDARGAAAQVGLDPVAVTEGDASLAGSYASVVPVDVALVCGVFGNVSDDDVRRTIAEMPGLCRTGATVIWTRHRKPPDRTTEIRRWWRKAGFAEVAFDASDRFAFGVGTQRFEGPALAFAPERRLFTFSGDGAAAHL